MEYRGCRAAGARLARAAIYSGPSGVRVAARPRKYVGGQQLTGDPGQTVGDEHHGCDVRGSTGVTYEVTGGAPSRPGDHEPAVEGGRRCCRVLQPRRQPEQRRRRRAAPPGDQSARQRASTPATMAARRPDPVRGITFAGQRRPAAAHPPGRRRLASSGPPGATCRGRAPSPGWRSRPPGLPASSGLRACRASTGQPQRSRKPGPRLADVADRDPDRATDEGRPRRQASPAAAAAAATSALGQTQVDDAAASVKPPERRDRPEAAPGDRERTTVPPQVGLPACGASRSRPATPAADAGFRRRPRRSRHTELRGEIWRR